MGRMLALLLAVVMMVSIPTHTAQLEWTDVARRLAVSTVSVQGNVSETETLDMQTICTGFSIDEQRSLFLTAQHCKTNVMRVDWQIATLVYEDIALDLMVLQSPGVKRPALRPRTGAVQAGLSIGMFGYAYGFESPVLRVGIVSNPEMLVPSVPAERNKTFMVVMPAPIGGMSGGPIVDGEGAVVGIVQMGNYWDGLSKPVQMVLKATSGFWEGR